MKHLIGMEFVVAKNEVRSEILTKLAEACNPHSRAGVALERRLSDRCGDLLPPWRNDRPTELY